MRVVHILKITGIAGAENHLLILLSGLRAQGVDARFLLLVEPHNPVNVFAAACDARKIPYERLVIYHHADVTVLFRLWRSLRRLKPDIVHTHMLHGDLYGIPAARTAGVPHIISSRHAEDDFRKSPLWRCINNILWQLTDRGIAISQAVYHFTVEYEGVSSTKLSIVHYGYDAVQYDRQKARQIFEAGDADHIVGIVCRLIEIKGLSYALKAFARVLVDFPTAQLVIIGDGPMRQIWENQAHTLGIENAVRFMGWRSDAQALMAGFDLFLVPSLREGFGLVALEAMAQHVPVIGSRVSAIPEIVLDGETGVLFPPRDIDALTTALKRLLSDPALCQAMGQQGEERVKAVFTTQRMIDQTLTLYQTVSELDE
jgi:glycosyltransferase involved in cell wall biosynthesis